MRFPEFNDEWNKDCLGDLCEVNGRIGFRGYTKSDLVKAGEGALTLGGKHIDSNDELDLSDPEYLSWEKYHESPEIKVKKNNIILAQRGTLGRSALIDKDIGKATINPSMVLLKNFNINNIFLHYFLTTTKIKKEIIRKSSSTAVPMISQREIKKIKISYPSSKEQIKVSNFFSSIDKKIDLMERKQDRLVKYKGGLLQKIFSEKSKLYTSKIGEIFEERSEKGFSDLELLSVTLKDGVIKRSDIESKDNSNINKDNYKHVLPGDIVYNSMRMWQGASGVSEFEGIVSPAYTILKSNNNENSYYFAYYFKTYKMINQFKKYSQGLTSDTWNLKYPLISEISIKIHPFKEQEKIADFLSKVDNKIDSVGQQLEKTKEFKKYLLQQMFV